MSGLDRVRLTSVRPGEERFLGATFADVARERGGHPSDVLADWVLEHDLAPGMMAESLSNNDTAKVAELVADPTTVIGASDAGAHLQMMCGAGDSTLRVHRPGARRRAPHARTRACTSSRPASPARSASTAAAC